MESPIIAFHLFCKRTKSIHTSRSQHFKKKKQHENNFTRDIRCRKRVHNTTYNCFQQMKNQKYHQNLRLKIKKKKKHNLQHGFSLLFGQDIVDGYKVY